MTVPSPSSLPDEPALAETVLELAPDAILVVDAAGGIRSANHRALELFGYDDLRGVPVDELVPAEVRRLHSPHRAAYMREPRTRSMGTGLDLSAARADGSTFPVEVALAPVSLGEGDGVVAIVRDITDRVDAQRRVLEIQQTLDATEEGVYIFDADTLAFDYVNHGAGEQVGYTREQLASMSILDLNPTMGEADLRDLIQPLLAGRLPSRTVATRHRRADGTEFDVECVLQCSTISREDGRRRIVAFCRDVTERLATEAQLRDAEQELGVREDRERIARDLHDTVIQRLFAAGMTLQGAATQAEEATSGRIRAVVDELDETIREIRQTIFRLTSHTLDRSSVRRQVVELVEAEHDALGVDPELAFNGALESLDDDVVDDLLPTLREALSNVARHASATKVRVTLTVEPDVLRLEVDDDGVGPSAERPDGNGLANMAERATALGGEARLERRLPRGSRLSWWVPLD